MTLFTRSYCVKGCNFCMLHVAYSGRRRFVEGAFRRLMLSHAFNERDAFGQPCPGFEMSHDKGLKPFPQKGLTRAAPSAAAHATRRQFMGRVGDGVQAERKSSGGLKKASFGKRNLIAADARTTGTSSTFYQNICLRQGLRGQPDRSEPAVRCRGWLYRAISGVVQWLCGWCE